MSETENELLDRIAQLAKSYRLNDEVITHLSQRNAVLIVGPTSVGKTMLMQTVIDRDPEFGFVPIFTTRDKQPDDPKNAFHYLKHDKGTFEKILQQIERGELVQLAVHPTTGRIFGTSPDDWSKPFNMMATLATVLDGAQGLPFHSVTTVAITTHPDKWEEWFRERWIEKATPEMARQRLGEAELSIRICLQRQVAWLYNDPDSLDTGADQLISLSRDKQATLATDEQVHALLERIISVQASL